MEITVTCEKVNVNGRAGYIATATNGQAYTTTHRQNTAEDAERVAVRLFKDGVIDGYYHSDDMRSENADGGSAEQTKQAIEYYPDWVSSLKNIMFYLLLFLIGGAALLSLVVLAVSIGVTVNGQAL